MASQPESDVIALVSKLINEGQIFSIVLESPDSPAVKLARERRHNSSPAFAGNDCHCVHYVIDTDGTKVCVEEKCD